jgi:hypothetical protein
LLKGLHWLGRGLGAFSGGALAVGWAYALWVPAAGLALADKSVIGGVSVVFVSLLMIALALIAAIGSFKGHFTVVILAFTASFLPVGLSLLPSADWVRWLGYLDVGLLVGALLIRITARAARPTEAVE